MKLSDNLKSIRKENNLSQEQLAEKLGVSRQAVSKWESDQSYPEMEKVLLICKLFNYNIDELMNESIKEVDEKKQSKINFNKYVEDFFNFITKTVDMLSVMKFKQKVKCLVEQIIVAIILVSIFAIIGVIGSSVIESMFEGISTKIYYFIRNICQSIYIILSLVVGITVLLHIFKIRYLDYYEILKEEKQDNKDESTTQQSSSESSKEENNNENKVFIEKKKEKVIIRDPEHSGSKFLTGIIKIVLWFIKFMVICFAIPFVFTFIIFVALLILSFLFIKTGLVFLGSLFGIISAILINFIVLELCYDFIVSKNLKKNRMATLFITALILAGMSTGVICIGITDFNYIENSELINEIEDTYNVKMTDNLSINTWHNIEYIETNSRDVKIVAKHSKYYSTNMVNTNETINLYYIQNTSTIMENIRDIINDINEKQIKNYNNPTTYVYASKDNIEKIKKNNSPIIELENTINNMETEILELENEIKEKDNIINILEEQITEKSLNIIY